MKKYLLLAIFSLILIGNNFAQQKASENDVFEYVDVMPIFPGGDYALQQFLSNNLKYPKDAKENKITGRVMMQFNIDKQGKVTEVKVVRSAGHASLDEEALRVINLMPQWSPGKVKDKPVIVRMQLPIKFSLP